MIRQLVGLKVNLTSVDVNSGCATHSKLRNKSQIPDAAREHNLPSKQATNTTHDDEAATSLNLYSPPRDSS